MKRWKGVLLGACAVFLAQGISYLAARTPALVERLYSRSLYPLLGRFLSRITAVVPFSLAEVVVVGLLVVALLGSLHWIFGGWRYPQAWLRQARAILTIALFAYAGFILLWGLNYYRQPLSVSLQLPVQPTNTEELADLCAELMIRTNAVRPMVAEDEQQVMMLNGGKWRALTRAELGYQELAKQLPLVRGRFGSPKGVCLSRWWSYTGTGGMYVPFTGEANVNMAMPDMNIPVVACHEMAHQRGIAREDEANYVAYLACTHHPDVEFQYSGLVMALSQAMQALRRNDPDTFAALQAAYDPGIIRDLQANQAFWQAFSGPVEQLSERMNDAYLKSNRQADGVESYGRMVDLLLAERRAASD